MFQGYRRKRRWSQTPTYSEKLARAEPGLKWEKGLLYISCTPGKLVWSLPSPRSAYRGRKQKYEQSARGIAGKRLCRSFDMLDKEKVEVVFSERG